MTSTEPIHYRIVPARPQAHIFEVRLRIAEPDPQGQVLRLPAWIPGSYMIRDFARHVVRLWAYAGEHPLAVDKLDASSWRCEPAAGAIEVVYEVYAWDLSVRTAYLDTTRAFFNGTSVFLAAVGQEHRAATVDIQPPPGDGYGHWRVATAMPRAGAPRGGFGTYRAPDYDALIDHPVEIGELTTMSFRACGVEHEVAIAGRHDADLERLCADLSRICEQHIGLFGEPAPVDYYLFLVMPVGEGYGGLEHRASTSLICRRQDLPHRGQQAPGDGYFDLLALASHEYFHTWNVKRIKPAAFVPYDLSRPQHTRLLWIFEGFTVYYEALALRRAELLDDSAYLERLGRVLSNVTRTSGQHKQSVAASSFDAWTKFYKQDENASNAIVSYYSKGAMIALALDLELRLETGGQYSLDDVMRALWREHGDGTRGLDEEGFQPLCEAVTGVELGDFLARAVDGTEAPPLTELLAAHGVTYDLRPAQSDRDRGGGPVKDADAAARRPELGASIVADPAGARLPVVREDRPAQEAGLAPGDVVIAVDGIRATADNLADLIGRVPDGERCRVHAFRRDELMSFEVKPRPAPAELAVLMPDPQASPEALARRHAWLASDSRAPATRDTAIAGVAGGN